MSKRRRGGFLRGVMWGAAIGAALGVLYAPDKGKETRKKLKEKKDAFSEEATTHMAKAKVKVEKVRVKAEPVIEEIQTKASDFVNTVQNESGPLKEQLTEIAEEVEDTIDQGLKKVKKTKKKFFKGL